MPEQLALEELVGKVGRVDTDEGTVRARGTLVQRVREPVLSDPALSNDENGRRQLDGAGERLDLARQRAVARAEPRGERRPAGWRRGDGDYERAGSEKAKRLVSFSASPQSRSSA